MMKDLLDALFWRHPYTGKRRPRPMFWGLVLSLVVVCIGVGALLWYSHNYSAALPPTPTPRPPTATPLPSPTFTPSPVPTATPVPVTAKDKLLAEIRGCDPDPANWTLADQHMWKWKVLAEPRCALDGLSRAVAWHIATRAMGYTADEAAQALGYPEGQWPWAPSRSWWTMFATAGKWGRAPLLIYFLPVTREWKVDTEGHVTGNILTLTPRGCYYAYEIEGGRKVWWSEYGFPFTVECFFYEDFTSTYTIWQLPSGTVGDEEDVPSRVSVLFAYAPDTGWVYLGRINDAKLGYHLEEFEGKLEGDYEGVRQHWGLDRLWDVAWVEETWEMVPHPLPQDWTPGMGKSEAFQQEWQGLIDDTLRWVREHGPYEVPRP